MTLAASMSEPRTDSQTELTPLNLFLPISGAALDMAPLVQLLAGHGLQNVLRDLKVGEGEIVSTAEISRLRSLSDNHLVGSFSPSSRPQRPLRSRHQTL